MIQDLFVELDRDKSGNVDIQEFLEGLSKLGVRPYPKNKAVNQFHHKWLNDLLT